MDGALTPVALDGGLVLRTATAADTDQVAALLVRRGEPADGVDARLVMEDPEVGPHAVAVVTDGERVVSTLTLLDATLEVARPGPDPVAVALSTGHIELVATDEAYEGRGLVRTLMGWAHRRSAARGHLVQVISGIPYFYRRFGYAYGIPHPRAVRLRRDWRPGAEAQRLTVRAAVPADVSTLSDLQREAQASVDIRLAHPKSRWQWLLRRIGTVQLIAECRGVAVGAARCTPPEDSVVTIGEIAARTDAAVEALLGFAVVTTDGTSAVRAMPTGPVASRVAEAAGAPSPDDVDDWYYVRLPDPVALLDRLRPVLDARLAASPLAAVHGEIVVSFYESSVRFPYGDGRIGPMERGGVVPEPLSVGGAGIPPDGLARVLFSDGALAVERAMPDCRLGRHRQLLDTLFPPVTSDLALFCLPG